jgi:apolipoprotein N-acyltransferase
VRWVVGAASGALTGAIHGWAFGHSLAAILELGALTVLAAMCFGVDVRRRPGLVFFVVAGFWLTSYAVGLRWLGEALADPLSLGPALGSLIFFIVFVGLASISVVCMWGALWLVAPLRSGALRCALVSGALLASDFLRELLLPSFPWLSVGYAHIESPFAALMPIAGAQGVAWAAGFVALLAGFLLASLLPSRTAARAGPLLCISLVAAGLGISSAVDRTLTRPAAAPVRVALMQTAESMRDKFTASHLGAHIGAVAQFAKSHDARLIIAPETAVPTTLEVLSPIQEQTLEAGVSRSKALVFGAFAQDSSGATYNSAVLLGPPADSAGSVRRSVYIKRHLAPIGEYTPRGFRWLAELLGLPMSDLRATEDPRIDFDAFGTTLIPSICLDLLYGEDLRTQTHAPRVLINLSSLAYFENGLARRQFMQIARARALEQQLPVLLAANFGPTAFIDRDGTVKGELPAGQAGALEVDVRPSLGVTPFARLGNLFSYGLLVLTCVAFVTLAAMRLAGVRPERTRELPRGAGVP